VSVPKLSFRDIFKKELVNRSSSRTSCEELGENPQSNVSILTDNLDTHGQAEVNPESYQQIENHFLTFNKNSNASSRMNSRDFITLNNKNGGFQIKTQDLKQLIRDSHHTH
jgi:hypothetical protein